MENIILYPKNRLTNEELMVLVRIMGGYTIGEFYAVLTRNEAAIFIDYLDSSDYMSDYEEEEIQAIRDKLDKMPNVGVSVHIGHDKESHTLCMNFAKIFLDKWGGILDNNHGKLFTKEELVDREQQWKDFWD